MSLENVLLQLLKEFRSDNFKTYESLLKHISEQLTIRKHAKAYENIMSVCSETGSDRHWSAKKQAPLTLPHVLKLTLDFIIVYNSATIKRLSPPPLKMSHRILHIIPFSRAELKIFDKCLLDHFPPINQVEAGRRLMRQSISAINILDKLLCA